MMQHKQVTAKDQISFSCFEDRISRDNPVRFIDIFSAKLDLEKVGSEHALIMLVYKIKRSMKILGVPDPIEKLKNFKHT